MGTGAQWTWKDYCYISRLLSKRNEKSSIESTEVIEEFDESDLNFKFPRIASFATQSRLNQRQTHYFTHYVKDNKLKPRFASQFYASSKRLALATRMIASES